MICMSCQVSMKVSWRAITGTKYEAKPESLTPRQRVRNPDPLHDCWRLDEISVPEWSAAGPEPQDPPLSPSYLHHEKIRYGCPHTLGALPCRQERALLLPPSRSFFRVAYGEGEALCASPWPVRFRIKVVTKARELNIFSQGFVGRCSHHPGPMDSPSPDVI